MVAVAALAVVPAGQVDTSGFTVTLHKAICTLINICRGEQQDIHTNSVTVSEIVFTLKWAIELRCCLLGAVNAGRFIADKNNKSSVWPNPVRRLYWSVRWQLDRWDFNTEIFPHPSCQPPIDSFFNQYWESMTIVAMKLLLAALKGPRRRNRLSDC